MPDELLLVGQAARQFKVPRRTLYSAIARGSLPAQRIGPDGDQHYLVKVADVQHWIRFGKHKPGRPTPAPGPQNGDRDGD